MKKLWMLFAAGFILTGCADNGNKDLSSAETAGQATSSMEAVTSVKDEDAISVTVHVKEDGKEIEDGTKELEVESGAILLDVMKENYEIEDDNDFITSINGHKQDDEAKKYWLFKVNGEDSMVGAHQTELQEGDVVEFNLEDINQ